MDGLITISRIINNVSQTYIKDITEKDEVLQNLISKGKDLVAIIERDGDITEKDIYNLSEFMVSLKSTKSFKDVKEKDELIYRIFKIIKNFD